jgi:hypothetical protein
VGSEDVCGALLLHPEKPVNDSASNGARNVEKRLRRNRGRTLDCGMSLPHFPCNLREGSPGTKIAAHGGVRLAIMKCRRRGCKIAVAIAESLGLPSSMVGASFSMAVRDSTGKQEFCTKFADSIKNDYFMT